MPSVTRRNKRKVVGIPFKKGWKGGPGRPRLNPLEKAVRKEIKAYAKQQVDTFVEACEKLLPLAVDRTQEILNRKGVKREGSHLRALDLLADRVFGRPPIAITGAGGGPLVVSFEQLLKEVDGSKPEKFL